MTQEIGKHCTICMNPNGTEPHNCAEWAANHAREVEKENWAANRIAELEKSLKEKDQAIQVLKDTIKMIE